MDYCGKCHKGLEIYYEIEFILLEIKNGIHTKLGKKKHLQICNLCWDKQKWD